MYFSLSVVFTCVLQQNMGHCEQFPFLSGTNFWQVKDGPDAAYPFRAFRRLHVFSKMFEEDTCWFCSEAKQDHNGAVCLMKLVNSSGEMGTYFPHFAGVLTKVLRKLCTLPLADASAAEAHTNLRHFRPSHASHLTFLHHKEHTFFLAIVTIQSLQSLAWKTSAILNEMGLTIFSS